MIRFIDLGTQITCDPQGDRCFAFFDTVVDKFMSFDGEQMWTAWIDFEEDFYRTYNANDSLLQRIKSLCPAWVFE